MKFYKKLPSWVLYFVRLFILEFLFFTFLRILFYLLCVTDSAKSVDLSDRLWAFRMGFEFDMIVICYSFFIPFLLLFLNSFLKKSQSFLSSVAVKLSFSVFFVYVFVFVADIPYFRQFGSHLSKQAFLWNDDPLFITGLVFGSFSYWSFLLLFLLLCYPLFRFTKWINAKFRQDQQEEVRWKWGLNLLCGLFCAGLLVAGARGRITKTSPTHEGLAVVCDDGFVNQLALNPNYTLLKSVFYYKTKKYVVPANIDELIQYTRSYFGITGAYERSLARQVSYEEPSSKMNVVIVVMESMSVFKMGYYHGKKLTPCLDKIIAESVFFNRFFSSGIHTFNGLFSTSSGYPAVMDEKSLVHYTRKPFQGIGAILGKENYDNYFFTSQDPHFDNMAGFFRINKFNTIISQYDFPAEQGISVLGVPDHVLLKKFIDTMNERKDKRPFLSMIMTSSDHGPWKIPKDIPFKPNTGNEQDNSTMYADWSLGEFMKEAKKQAWYNNTLFVFLGDHGLSMGHTYEMPLSYHHIPFVIHQPALLKPDTVESLGYQPDVTETLLGLLRMDHVNEGFGIDLFREQHPFVMFTADDKIGSVNRSGEYYYNLLSQQVERFRKYESLDPRDYYPEMKSRADSLAYGANAILETARYFIHENYYQY